jgi:hypothetical protein
VSLVKQPARAMASRPASPTSSRAASAGVFKPDSPAPFARGELAPHASAPFPWLDTGRSYATPNVLRSTPAHTPSARRAGDHPATSGVSRGGGSQPIRSPLSPFGPPGRGAVSGSSGASGATGGSALWCAVLVGFLVFSVQPLRRHRVVLVAAGPVGFSPLQQRPG